MQFSGDLTSGSFPGLLQPLSVLGVCCCRIWVYVCVEEVKESVSVCVCVCVGNKRGEGGGGGGGGAEGVQTVFRLNQVPVTVD